MHLRRTIAVATGALVLSTLTSCGFDFATDREYTPANGVNNRDASVDVLGAVIVSAEEGSGTFIASFANNSTEEAASFTTLEGIDQAQLTADEFDAMEIPASGLVNLATEGGVEVTGEFEAGNFVPVSVQFDNGEQVEMEIPVVTNCGYFENLDGPSDPEQCETEHTEGEH
jgi:hypothetical protein